MSRRNKKSAYRIKLAVLASALCSMFFSCEFLRTEAFGVVSWLPGEGYQDYNTNIPITLTFSQIPDTVSVEDAVTLTADGTELKLSFVWEGELLYINPDKIPDMPSDYAIRIARSAQTPDGLSLDEDAEFRFTTRANHDRPSLLSNNPADSGSMDLIRQELILTFDEPVDLLSLQKAITVSPAMAGYWELDEESLVATFTPLQDWDMAQEYSVKIGTDLVTTQNMALAEATSFKFWGGPDRIAAQLLSVVAIDDTDSIVLTLLSEDPLVSPQLLNSGWEDTWRLQLQFDEPIKCGTLDARFLSEGGPSLRRVGNDYSSSTIVYSFTEKPEWNSVFLLKINMGIEDSSGNKTEDSQCYRIFANGTHSRPPEVLAIRMPLMPGAGDMVSQQWTVWSLDDSWGVLALQDTPLGYPVDTNISTFIEVYLRLADSASLDVFSLMESFRVEATGGAVSFSPKQLITEFASFENSVPAPEVDLPYIRVQINGTLRNTTEAGIVKVILSTALRDNGQRALPEQWQLPLMK